MNHLKKAGIILILGIAIILFREYEWNKKISQTPEISERAELIRVVDGDTIVVNLEGKEEKIRIIGMNTPESVKPHSPVECFGKESSIYAEKLFTHYKTLDIKTDPTQDTRDRNGRLLAHVFIDGANFAEQMIAGGYSYEYTYRKPYIYQSEYRIAEKNAKEQKLGLWSEETCNGNK